LATPLQESTIAPTLEKSFRVYNTRLRATDHSLGYTTAKQCAESVGEARETKIQGTKSVHIFEPISTNVAQFEQPNQMKIIVFQAAHV